MIKVINALNNIDSVYPDGSFSLDKWSEYISFVPENIFYQDMENMLGTGMYTFEDDYLPVLNSLIENKEKIKEAEESFAIVTENLEERILEVFGKTIDVEIVLYLGLCNGAGWATKIHDKDYVFLGIEKIVELDWCSPTDMKGLIWHELGHIYEEQHGILDKDLSGKDSFLWQLYTEGIAMYFEQRLSDDEFFFHQDKNGWLEMCQMLEEIMKTEFNNDLTDMSIENQRYFGDWVNWRGLPDTGYYLGSRFIWQMSSKCSFDELINMDIETVNKEWNRYLG